VVEDARQTVARACWRKSHPPAGGAGARVGGLVVGNESVFGNRLKSDRQLSNKPLQRMKAASSRSTVNEPWPRGSSDERWPPRGHGSATIDQPVRPSPLNGKALARTSQPLRCVTSGAILKIGIPMKKRWAVLIVLGGLLLGIMTPRVLLAGGPRKLMHTMISCMLLGEAEKAGYLDKAKRATLIDDLTNAKSLNPDARQSAATMKADCLSYP